jgi:hypothetical protein
LSLIVVLYAFHLFDRNYSHNGNLIMEVL